VTEVKAFGYAIHGIINVVRSERNMRAHLCIAFYVVIAGFVSDISAIEWAAVLICIALVLGAECINTSLEYLCDALHPEWSKQIGRVKDTAAAAVLICSAAAAAVGSIIFFQADKIKNIYVFIVYRPLLAVVLTLALIPIGIFIFGSEKEKKNNKLSGNIDRRGN